MVGDEPRAKQLLLAMQDRLARDPYEALGVAPGAQPVDVRNAFLGLTKTYHPARFARMAVDVQKLANEVFLALRAAQDQLSRPSVNSGPTARRSGPIAATPPRASSPPLTAPHGARPSIAPQTTSGGGVPVAPSAQASAAPASGVPSPASSAQTAPYAGTPSATSPSTRPTAPSAPEQRPAPAQRFVSPASTITRPYGTTTPPGTPGTPGPSGASPGAGASMTGSAPAATPPATRTGSTGSIPALSRTSTSRIGQQGRNPAASPTPMAPPTVTPVSNPRVTPATGVPAISNARTPTVDRELAPILELLNQGQFAASRIALETLAARSPDVVRYRALIAYAKGREAQLARRIDEARVELQQALQIDPNLELAKTALAELFTRRK
ncbi:MAG: hypothetical protein SFX73_24855 [Kofleriaceae bacterium]|nr:hypothetical protein [Kofleriaceae bacterium]